MVSAAKIKADAVRQDEDGSWGLTCPLTDGSCGDPAKGVSFTSPGWPTKAIAADRLETHLAEHREGAAARTQGRPVDRSKIVSVEDFRAKHNLVPHPDGKRAVLDIGDLS